MKGWGSLVVGMAGLVSCLALAPADHAASKHAVNFANDVAPILYDKCARCHHTGEVAPFSLVTYSDAKSKAKTIVAAVTGKYMPPWQAHSHGEFLNERTLTPDQIATLSDWAAQG